MTDIDQLARAREVLAQAFERAGDRHAAECVRLAPAKRAAREAYALPLHHDVALDAIAAAFATPTPSIASQSGGALRAWQPIATAPRDGTWFIAVQDGDTYPCEWRREEYDEGAPNEGWYDLFNQSFEAPTLWSPVPSLTHPSTTTGDGGRS